MELSVTQENLKKALQTVSRVATNKAGLPILGSILFRTDNNRLMVAATNLEIAVTYHIGTKIITNGSITVPARLISEFVASLPKGTVNLKVEDNHLNISSESYASVINGQVADEFPELPTIDEKSSITYTINAIDLKEAVGQTTITCSSDTTRPILTGVYWHTFKKALYLAATDGYRLSERRLFGTTNEVAALIPSTTLQEVVRTITDESSEVDVLFDETQVRFRVGEAEITSRLIDGTYPDYRQLIPASSETSVVINKTDFMRVTKIAGLFARESGGSVTLTADKDNQRLSIHSIASELGENTSSSDANITGEGQVTLNSRYLSEALSVMDSDTVEFRFSGKLSPCVLTSAGSDVNYKHIIMPLKS